MYKKVILTLLAILLIGSTAAFAEIATISKKAKDKKETIEDKNQIQKEYTRVFDLQKNSVSNIEFYTTNYGIFGLDVKNSVGGGIWPRGSQNQYIFGGGIWFAAQKQRVGSSDPNDLKKLVEVSYNPNSGTSWFVPGRIEEGDPLNQDDILLHRTLFSTDFKGDGTPLVAADKYNWPIWDDSAADTLKKNRYFGHYIANTSQRDIATFTKGPSFISGEDIFATYKDTDLSYFEGGVAKMTQEGYPLRLQYEQTIYSWGFGDYKDFIFLRYEMINMNEKALKHCWLAPVMDVDIALTTNSRGGASNDRVKFFDLDETLNLAIQWSNSDQGERARGFGYLGFDFLESPAVDANGDLRKDKRVYTNGEQLGLVTFRNWSIEEDKQESEERYNFISSTLREGDTGPGDKRFLMATGPFNMQPGDTARVIVGIILASTSKGSDADGTVEDMEELIRKDKFAQQVYDNNFQAPTPPGRSNITDYKVTSHGIEFQWDETSELSIDPWEKGLAFMGFKIFRARRTNLDTFDVNVVAGAGAYPRGKGPYGWKQIAKWELPKPFYKSYIRAGGNQNNLEMPLIDSMEVVGAYTDYNGKVIDTMAIRVMRVINGGLMLPKETVFSQIKSAKPFLAAVDTSIYSAPWGKEYLKMLQENEVDFSNGAFTYEDSRRITLFDSVMVGVIKLNKALVPYNPLFYKRTTAQVNTAYLDSLLKLRYFADGIIGKLQYLTFYDSATQKKSYDTIRITVDTVYKLTTLKKIIIGGISYNVIDKLVPQPISQQTSDLAQVKEVLDSVYYYLANGLAKTEFPNWEQSLRARKQVIVPYMAEQTKNRTFIDIGDDNKDGKLEKNNDPAKNEGLTNNVPYYYKVLAYDEGDYTQPTPTKVNDGSEGLPNLFGAQPSANSVSEDPDIQVIITPEDSLKLGGLYNFKMYSLDKDRLLQNFAGHDLELTFTPIWNEQSVTFTGRSDATTFGLYQSRVKLVDLNTDNVLFDAFVSYEDQPCTVPYRGSFTEDAASFVLADTVVVDSVSGAQITFGTQFDREIRTRSGKFSTGTFRDADPAYCYTLATLAPAYGTLGFSFDFTMHQYGGRFRPDSLTLTTAKMPGEDAVTPINFIDDMSRVKETGRVMTTQQVGVDYTVSAGYTVDGSFNNGPGEYEVEFLPGGKETLNIEWGTTQKQTAEFDCDYLTIKVTNKTKFKRVSENGIDSVEVHYPTSIPAIDLPLYVVQNPYAAMQDAFPARYFPDPRNLGYGGVDRLNPKTNEFIGKHNLVPFGWVNLDKEPTKYNTNPLTINKEITRSNYSPYNDDNVNVSGLGKQNKYYLTGKSKDGANTIYFTHTLNIGGIQFGIDYANMGKTNSKVEMWTPIPSAEYAPGNGPDFQVGDKITLKTYGGALGLPMPGAKVLFRINNPKGNNGEYTNELLDGVQVVPNPYFITHDGQKSPYDASIYFTKLPKECTISIYTVNGELVKTLDHKDIDNAKQSQAAVAVWDLLSFNGQRVQSQAFVAHIKSADGAETIRNFSVVVGGFRLITE